MNAYDDRNGYLRIRGGEIAAAIGIAALVAALAYDAAHVEVDDERVSAPIGVDPRDLASHDRSTVYSRDVGFGGNRNARDKQIRLRPPRAQGDSGGRTRS